jgi:hypothetical protein
VKKLLKILAITFAFWLAVFNPVNISLVYAQTDTPTDTPAATDSPTSTPADTSQPSSTPSPTDTPSSSPTSTPIASPTDTPAVTPTPSPSVSPSPTDTPIVSPSPTDDPSLTASPTDTPTGTPIATDSGTIDPNATASASPTDSPADSSSSDSSGDPVSQSGTTNSTTGSSSDTGNNSQASSGGSATTATGDAASTANSVTVTNLSQVNSNLIVAIQNILNSSSPDVNLYQALEEAIANNPNFVPGDTSLTVDQTANSTTDTTSTANTGSNSQTTTGTNASDSADMTTGEALSLANAINATNLNLIGSNTVLTIINILTDWNGNIILPSGSQLSTDSSATGNVNLNASQSANVTTNTASTADTGSNTQTGGSSETITTGNSASAANSGTLVNVIEIGNGLGYLIINDSGNWSGSLINWSAPGSVQTLGGGSYNLLTEYDGAGGSGGTGTTNITSNQTADVNTNVSSSASTGSNSQTGGTTSLTTGSATSLANNFTLANFTGIGGGIFLGIINIIGNWTGNIITAYPELQVGVTDNQSTVNPGGEENYLVTITNAGRATAHGVGLNFTFPSEVAPVGPETTSWNLGNLNPGQSQTFTLTGNVDGSAPDGTELIASATGSTGDAQDSTSGDTGTDTTDVVAAISDPSSDPPPDTRTPDLNVDIWNSVGAFIYPGDTIWTTITIHNNSPFPADNVSVAGSVTDSNQNVIAPLSWNLGTLKAEDTAKISFNVTIAKGSPGGTYNITAQATGQSDSGDSSTSNLADSSFVVNAGTNSSAELIAPPVAGTTGGISGGMPPAVLGASTASTQKAPAGTNNYLAIFPALGLAYLLIVSARKRLYGEPVISPAFAEFFKKRKVAIAGSLFAIIGALLIFIRRGSS